MNLGKRKKSWPARVFVKYLLIQMLSWALWALVLILVRHWIHFPGWVIPAFVVAWAVKDMVMFPFVWRAYDSEQGKRAHPRAGDRAVVVKRLSPEGYVRVDGELWRAEMTGKKGSLAEGGMVRVMDIRGLTLIVEPAQTDCKDGQG
jgi:membrane protein implicated in regulation of membrane protease activity